MSYAVVLSRANQGLDAPLVRVEVHLSNGLPAFTVVGMPETAVRESKDRVRSALLNSHFEFPDRRITVNLAPADLPKGGGRFDLPIALGILCASGQLPQGTLLDSECVGELALDGTLRSVRGTVTAAMAASQNKRRIVLSLESASLCKAVPHSRLVYAADLLSLCAILRGRAPLPDAQTTSQTVETVGADMAEVNGQLVPKRALEIAASGGHNLLLSGPPGTGKSLLANCLPGILPPPDDSEWLTVCALYDIQGKTHRKRQRAFRAPHHSASAAALVGGGSIPAPGEISLAHGGVLFLDELPEFSRHTLDMLREPLETGEIRLARATCSIRYPARFQLIAAMNPCPCGYAGDGQKPCKCGAAQRLSYGARVSGPLLDRMDLQVRVNRENAEDLFAPHRNESSATVQKRVVQSRKRQYLRQGKCNAMLKGSELLEKCACGPQERQLIQRSAKQLDLSARAIHRLLRVARSVADLRKEESVTTAAVKEALAYRDTVNQE
ncbi:YifB family Mg chelatase-like AAA ATPase [Congregibacter brevis]|uniref:YifB family Mg chelatase-like AAA ATPase n=1 Tax=Congregibacter brevis TaxID=3081201 RepID=A0ABZ0IFC8_9GAMM|nr:YifB family Mg chelatase-like AAA ATPase [Congregibacter sp. IMCC45268]